MRHFKKIPFWENKARQEAIEKYIALLKYFYSSDRLGIREKIFLSIHNVHDIVETSDSSTCLRYTPAPMIGGYIQDIDVILNFDVLMSKQIPVEKVFDILNMALGKYRDDYRKSVIRTFSPLFWLGCVIDYLISIPFALFGWIGFNREKVEYSFLGRFVKGVVKLIAVIGVILGILHHLGYMEPVKNFVNKQVDTYILRVEPQIEEKKSTILLKQTPVVELNNDPNSELNNDPNSELNLN